MTAPSSPRRLARKTAANGAATEAAAGPTAAPVAHAELLVVPLGQIVPSSENPRRNLGDLTELAASIAGVGLLEPLVVAKPTSFAPSVYPLVAGHRRLAAAQLAGLAEIPVVVRAMSDREQLEAMLVENLQRLDLDVLEEAAAYSRLITELGMTQRNLAQRIGRSQSHIAKRLALLELPEPAKAAVDSGRITLEEAALLGKLTRHPARLTAALENGTRFEHSRVRDEAQSQLDDLEREEQAGALEAELRAEGKKVLPPLRAGSYLGREALLQQPETYLIGHQHASPFSVSAHCRESCHAAVISIRQHHDPKVFWVCTNPARHEPEGASELKLPKAAQRPDKTPEQLKQAELRKQELAALKARKEFSQKLLERIGQEVARGGRNTSDDYAHLVNMLLADANHNPAKIACEFLGIPPVEKTSQWGSKERNFRKALEDFGQDRPGSRLRAALALVLGLGEDTVRSPWSGAWVGGKGAHHMAYLQAMGYEPSEFEIEKLKADPEDSAPGTHDDGYEDDDEIPECRVCGCTEDEACEGGCHWVPDPEDLGDLCSRCLEDLSSAKPIEDVSAGEASA